MRARTTATLLIALPACFLAAAGVAQVSPEAIGSNPHLWVGVEGSNFKPDYNPIAGRLDGIGIWADYNLAHHLGLEGEVRLLDLNRPAGQTQKTFLAGPILDAVHYRRFVAYGKILAGAVTVNYPYLPGTHESIGYGSYFGYAVGGGAEYQLNSRWRIRGEYEHEWIPSAPGFVITQPLPSNGLTPVGYSAGVSYRVF